VERDQHLTQDAAEVYAVAVMQQTAEALGVAGSRTGAKRMKEFQDYLDNCGLSLEDFDTGLYGKYKTNVDLQIPAFVRRLSEHFPGAKLDFRNDEAAMRVRGLKGDFLISVSTEPEEIAVSLKNYIGGGGITRPQVSSGTYLSFACGFVFDRVGVGQYADPRGKGAVFLGRDAVARNAVLSYERRNELIEPLAVLERLQQEMRTELLGPDCVMYDRARVRAVVDRIAQPGIETVLHIFDLLGIDVVRDKFLARIGLDGKEESLFFDSERYVDSITNRAYHDLRERINAPETTFSVAQYKQNIRFSFTRGPGLVLKTDVPFTINTNGAWFRPKQKFSGKQTYNDKGHDVQLRWGERRPYKSMEIATSTNTYLDLAKVGIFGK
jgi:hypothetical protein